MNERSLEDTRKAEKQLAAIYIAMTVEAILICVMLAFVALYNIGMSTFGVLQAIGSILVVLVVASLILKLRKGRLKKNLLEALKKNGTDPEEFESHLEAHPFEFEFIHALFIDTTRR